MPKLHKGSIRLKCYDYCSDGIYFVTICTYRKEKVFGKIEKNKVILNEYGKIAQNEWIKTAQIRTYVILDAFVIMPDHMHGIIIIDHNYDDNYNMNHPGNCKKNSGDVGSTGPVEPTMMVKTLIPGIVGCHHRSI